jgi:lipoyl(octanoyl) transferase
MKIEIKKSIKPVEYKEAIDFLEKRLVQINQKKETELIWILEHPNIYTAGTSYNENEILDKSINVVKTNRGGKITYHGPGQTICYFVIDLNRRK